MIHLVLAFLEMVNQNEAYLQTERWLHNYRVARIVFDFSDQESVDYADSKRLK